MSDRTSCTLQVWGIATRYEVEQIYSLLESEFSLSHSSARKNLEADHATIFAYDVNFAELPENLAEHLESIPLSYAWSWDSGGDYPAGIQVHDAAANTHNEFQYSHGNILLGLSDIDREGAIEKARRTQALLRKANADKTFRLHVAETAHDLLGLMVEYPELAKIREPESTSVQS